MPGFGAQPYGASPYGGVGTLSLPTVIPVHVDVSDSVLFDCELSELQPVTCTVSDSD